MQVNRRLYRCRQNRRIAGVAGGIAESFGVDPTAVRVLWFLSIFFGGFSILLYIALAFIVPLEPMTPEETAAHEAELAAGGAGHAHAQGSGSGRLVTFAGIGLVIIGSLAFLNVLLPTPISWHFLWPVLLVAAGAVLIVGAVRREPTQG
jgi:phage shock protein C